MKDPKDMSKEELLGLLEDASKNWLAHDGLWFRAVENRFGIEAAMDLDKEAWEKFTVIEAKRIMKRLGIEPGGGIPALIQSLKFRLYAHINVQEVLEVTDTRCVFRMNKCRVQEARKRQGLPDFPCKSVGIIEYSLFAKTIDSRIKTRCLICPPDLHPEDIWCAWEFTLAPLDFEFRRCRNFQNTERLNRKEKICSITQPFRKPKNTGKWENSRTGRHSRFIP